MDRRSFLACAATFSALYAARLHAKDQAAGSLNKLLQSALEEHQLPGIAAAVVRGDKTVAEAVAGVRKIGGEAQITLDNRFGMASCTKRMTAAMVCRVIDTGRLLFDTTLAEALPKLDMRDEYKPVTVAQLLNHTAGLPSYLQVTPDVAPSLQQLSGTPAEQRAQFIKRLLQEEPIVKPGTESRYSNAGYALVGFVAEQRTGKSWEALMTEEVFQPLQMTTAGFGRPRSKDRPDEPWLHHWTGEKYEPETDDRASALAPLAPAGNVHCSIRDFAKFAAYELQAARGNNSLLSPKTAERFGELSRRPARQAKSGPKTKTGPGDLGGKSPKLGKGPKAGKGQSASGNAFFGGSAYISSGCMLWPDKDLAAVVAVNAGGGHAAINEIFQQIEKPHA